MAATAWGHGGIPSSVWPHGTASTMGMAHTFFSCPIHVSDVVTCTDLHVTLTLTALANPKANLTWSKRSLCHVAMCQHLIFSLSFSLHSAAQCPWQEEGRSSPCSNQHRAKAIYTRRGRRAKKEREEEGKEAPSDTARPALGLGQ